MNYFEQLKRRSAEIGSLVCVGLDPDAKRHKVGEIGAVVGAAHLVFVGV